MSGKTVQASGPAVKYYAAYLGKDRIAEKRYGIMAFTPLGEVPFKLLTKGMSLEAAKGLVDGLNESAEKIIPVEEYPEFLEPLFPREALADTATRADFQEAVAA